MGIAKFGGGDNNYCSGCGCPNESGCECATAHDSVGLEAAPLAVFLTLDEDLRYLNQKICASLGVNPEDLHTPNLFKDERSLGVLLGSYETQVRKLCAEKGVDPKRVEFSLRYLNLLANALDAYVRSVGGKNGGHLLSNPR